jgi:hypothetical protein
MLRIVLSSQESLHKEAIVRFVWLIHIILMVYWGGRVSPSVEFGNIMVMGSDAEHSQEKRAPVSRGPREATRST